MYATGNSTMPNLSNYHTHICRINTGKIEEILRSDDPGKHRNSSLDTYNCHDDRPMCASNLWIMFCQTNLPIDLFVGTRVYKIKEKTNQRIFTPK